MQPNQIFKTLNDSGHSIFLARCETVLPNECNITAPTLGRSKAGAVLHGNKNATMHYLFQQSAN